MKSNCLLIAALCFAVFTAHAQSERYVTLILSPSSGMPNSNSLAIAENETAQVVDLIKQPNTSLARFTFIKDGISFTNSGQFLKGPASLVLSSPGYHLGAMATVKLSPDSYDANKTLILPPGTNQVYVALESSTNLVNWADATNGVYGSPDTARFFRIRMETLH